MAVAKVSMSENGESIANYFDLLGVESSFEIAPDKLEENYLALQRQFHPDRFVRKPEQERLKALQSSMDINNAYEVLKNPLHRAQHLLRLNAIEVNNDGANIKPSQDILLESMEAREKLEDAATKEEIELLKTCALANMANCIEQLKSQFKDKNFEKAAQNTIRLRYLEKYLEEIKARK